MVLIVSRLVITADVRFTLLRMRDRTIARKEHAVMIKRKKKAQLRRRQEMTRAHVRAAAASHLDPDRFAVIYLRPSHNVSIHVAARSKLILLIASPARLQPALVALSSYPRDNAARSRASLSFPPR